MPGKSKKTKVIGVRMLVEDVGILERRARLYPGEMTASGYIRMTMEYILRRKHIKTRGVDMPPIENDLEIPNQDKLNTG
jgi:hypothetical protein